MHISKSFFPPSTWSGWNQQPVRTEDAGCCIICNANQFHSHAEGYDYELGTCSNKWIFQCCESCGHVQLDPRPAMTELSTIYPANYYSYNMEKKVSKWMMRGKQVLDGFRLRSIFKAFGKNAKTYLDVGCGDGKYLDRMCALNMRCESLYGIELDTSAVEKARAKGYQVFQTPVEYCAQIVPGSIDVITLFHVIEHVSNPNLCIEKLASWLSAGGVLAIETPNRESLDARWFSRGFWGGYHIPRHWHIFSDDGLKVLLQRHGLEVVKCRFVSGHSFWLYSFHHWLAYNQVCSFPRLAQLFDPMKSRCALVLVTGFDYLRAACGFKTSSVLVIARKI